MQVLLAQAKTTVCIFGRGTGKTSRITSENLRRKQEIMPQSFGAIASNSYTDIVGKLIKGIKDGWKAFDFLEERDYVIGKINPKWKTPFQCPKDAKHMIHTRFGSGIGLIAVDKPALAAGENLDYICVEECKHIDYEDMAEILPAIRGGRDKFGHLSDHGSRLFVTDMPTTEKGKWVLNFEKQHDDELITNIINLALERNRLILDEDLSENYVRNQLKMIDYVLNEWRTKAVHFVNANSLENAEMLGEDWFFDQLKSFKHGADFKAKILNIYSNEPNHKFYRFFSEKKHTHFIENDGFISNLSFENHNIQDSRWDGDCDPNEALHISADYNIATNQAVVGQFDGTTLKILKHFHASQKDSYKGKKDWQEGSNLEDCALKFCEYYKFHKRKEIYLYYDHTGTQGYNGNGAYMPKNEWTKYLKQYGWIVHDKPIGQPMNYKNVKTPEKSRILFLEKVFTEQLAFRVSLNYINCEDLIVAIKSTAIRDVAGKIEKDKRNEKLGSSVPFAQQTHGTEAFDHLLEGFDKYFRRSAQIEKTMQPDISDY
jgi:hypothetical protein